MKKKLLMTLVLAVVLVVGGKQTFGQTTFWSEDFDNNTQYSVTLGGEGNDGSGDYFQRTDGLNINKTYTGIIGSNFFAGQDIDDGGWAGSANPSQLTWSSISISGYSGLQFKGYFASAATTKIDDVDYIHVEYRIDGGAWTNLIWFENDGTTYNTYFLEDTDFDGDGDGTPLSGAFAQFTKSIAGTGTTLDIQFTAAVNSGDEDFAIDYFELLGSTGGNTPASITNIVHTPAIPESTETVSVSADVTDVDGIFDVELHWGTASGSLGNTISMTGSGNTYTTDTDIPTQIDGTTVYYEVYVLDDEAEETTSAEQSYTVTDPTPTITLSPTSLSGFTYLVGNGPSTEQTFTVEGSNLTNDISIAATTNYEISETSGSGYTSPITLAKDGSGTVATTTIYVRLKSGLTAGTYDNEDIIASSGTTEETLSCNGNVTDGLQGGMEDFSNFPETGSSYLDGTFTGQDGSTWTYNDCRGDQTITNETPCLKNATSANVFSGTINNGIGTLSFDYMQAFSTDVNLDVLVNGLVVGTVTSNNEQGIVKNSGNITVNVSGDFVITFQQNTSPTGGQVAIDNITWTGYAGGSGPDAPTALSASAFSTSQIDLSWTENVAGNDVLIAWSADGTFGDPVDGTSYAADAAIPGGGTSLGTDADQTFSHTGLTPNTLYYYKIWSVDGSTNYSTGVEANATTHEAEPSNHVTGFTATANSSNAITIAWTDSDAASYLIKSSDVGYASIVAPVDGVAETDGMLVKNVASVSGANSCLFTGLSANTTYYFKIYPYNGSNATVNYLVDGNELQDEATTDEADPLNAWINEFHYDNTATDVDEFIEVVVENVGNYVLSDFQITLYSGHNGGLYDQKTLDNFTQGNTTDGFTFFYYYYPQNGIENGDPDGMALSYQGTVITGQFLSYEGSFEAVDGPADGLTSTDISVAESSATAVGESLQLGGMGTAYDEFAWQTPLAETHGALNVNQYFTPPLLIANIVHTPALPNASQTVSVSADVTDDVTIAGVELHWGTTSGSLTNTINMSLSSGDTYITDTEIPAQAQGTTVFYEIYALNDDLEDATSAEQSYTIPVPASEPLAHVTNFAIETTTASTISLSWTDSDADFYLVKASNIGYNDITAPTDGVPESDDTWIINVASGIQSCQFTELIPLTTYYFKIYPYNGSGVTINYKTDGSVPQVDASTTAPNVFISEYVEGSSDNKAIEIYNGTDMSVDLSDYTVKFFADGSTTAAVSWTGTTTLEAGETHILYNSSAATIVVEKGSETSGAANFNGNDAIGLYFDANLIDVVGEIGADPGTAWDVAGVTEATMNRTLVRKPDIASGNTSWASSAGTNSTNSEWIVFEQDHFFNLGVFGTGWTGATDNDWHTAGNWDVQVPDGTVNVLINACAPVFPTATVPATCKNLRLEILPTCGDASLFLQSTTLTLTGTSGN